MICTGEEAVTDALWVVSSCMEQEYWRADNSTLEADVSCG